MNLQIQTEGGRGIMFLEQKSFFLLFFKVETWREQLPWSYAGSCRDGVLLHCPAGRALLCPRAPGHAGGKWVRGQHGKGNSQNPTSASKTSNSTFKFHLSLFRTYQTVFSFQHTGLTALQSCMSSSL